MCSCIEVIRSGEVKKSRKIHHCMAFEWIHESVLCNRQDFKLTFSEWRSIAKMKIKRGKILVGESYIWQYNKQDGEFMTFKANKEMHDICIKYDLYPCDC